MNYTVLKTYRAYGRKHGYPHPVNVLVAAENIEAAHEEAEEKLDVVDQVSGPLDNLPTNWPTSGY